MSRADRRARSRRSIVLDVTSTRDRYPTCRSPRRMTTWSMRALVIALVDLRSAELARPATLAMWLALYGRGANA